MIKVILRSSMLVLLGLVSACSASSLQTAPPLAPQSAMRPNRTYPIKHIVVVVQENRSFENFFAGFPGANAPMQGKTHTGATVDLKPVDFSAVDMPHLYKQSQTEWNGGKNDGFDLTPAEDPSHTHKYPMYPYSYVQRSLIQPYWTLAKRYALADHMFSTIWGASFTAHQALIAGSTAISSSASVVDVPRLTGGGQTTWKCDATPGTITDLLTSAKVYEPAAGPFPCFTYPTIADSLDAAGVSWKYYDATNVQTGNQLWNAFGAIQKIYKGPDWHKVVYTKNLILKDAKNGDLPAVSWVIPDNLNSDHPGVGSDTGPSWVASVVNAIGTGPDWDSTAIVIVWDEWGGWYDNVPPPQLDYAGLGFRVPCIVVSPYARNNYVSHTQYEFGSILKTIEEVFHTRPIGGYATDARAHDMLDIFNFQKKPAPYKVVPAKYSREFFERQKPSGLPVDDE